MEKKIFMIERIFMCVGLILLVIGCGVITDTDNLIGGLVTALVAILLLLFGMAMSITKVVFHVKTVTLNI